MTGITATERLYLTADRERVVAEGDPAAAFLFTTPGKEISAEDVARYGLAAPEPEPELEPEAEVGPEPEEKQADPPADKQAPAPADKAVKKAPAKRAPRATNRAR